MNITRFSSKIFVLCLAVLGGTAISGSAIAATRVGGPVNGSETWTRDGNPYVATADIVVGKGASLQINPGVKILFKPNINDGAGTNRFDLEIQVEGTLRIRGAAGDTVILASDAPAPQWTDWQGIVVKGKEARADLAMVRIEDANTAVKVLGGEVKAKDMTVQHCGYQGFSFLQGTGSLDNVVITRIANPSESSWGLQAERKAKVTMRHCFVIDTVNGLLFNEGSEGLVENTVIAQCGGNGVTVGNAHLVVTGCSITANGVGIMWTGGSSPEFHRNNIFDNPRSNVLVRGYKGKPIQLDFTSNWWGVTDLSLIEDHVVDATDDPDLGATVLLEPFLKDAASSPVVTPEKK